MSFNDFNGDSYSDDMRIRKNRIKMYKNVLNYYRGKSLSLDFILASKQPNIAVIPEIRTYEGLNKDIQKLLDDIVLVQSLKNCLKLVTCSLANTEIMSYNDMAEKRAVVTKMEGIIYFSKSIMKLYNDCYTELDMVQKMTSHRAALAKYSESLHNLKANDKGNGSENSKDMEKAENYIYKINLMRIMKSVLIGYISLNRSSLLRSVLQFKSPMRRDLTIDDFYETWDVGLASTNTSRINNSK